MESIPPTTPSQVLCSNTYYFANMVFTVYRLKDNMSIIPEREFVYQ